MPDTEVEATLVIRSPRPERTARKIAGLESVAGRSLEPRSPLCVRDVYLDAPDGRMKAVGAALRLRHVGTDRRIAVKGPGRPLDGAGVDRLELERAWSRAALEEIRECLDRLGAPLPTGADAPADPGDPREVARRLGLEILQDRETLRRPAGIRGRRGDAGPAGELVVDRVAFRPGGVTVLHYEVEIEAGGAEDAGTLRDVTEGLRDRFGPRLLPWDHPKLSTGRALHRLEGAGELEEIRGEGGILLPRAYDRLRPLLEADTAGD